jgi:hypothetical protein
MKAKFKLQRLLGVLGLVVAPAWLTSAVSGEDASKAAPERVHIGIELAQPTVSYHVGDSLKATARISNISADAVVLPRWAGDWHVNWYISVLGFPSAQGSRLVHERHRGGYSGPYRRDDFQELAAGKNWESKPCTEVLMIPGKARLTARYSNHEAAYYVGGTNKDNAYVKMPNAWTGRVFGSVEIDISAEMPADMAKRFDEARKTVDSATETDVNKLKTLGAVAEEKHYFAARFIAETWRESKNPAVKAEALSRLVTLLDFGTAYESLPDLIKVLRDDAADTGIRRRILSVVKKMGLGRQSPGMVIADQAYYALPDGIRKEVLQTLGVLGRGKDPYLAVEAKGILAEAENLKAGAAAKPKEKPQAEVPK